MKNNGPTKRASEDLTEYVRSFQDELLRSPMWALYGFDSNKRTDCVALLMTVMQRGLMEYTHRPECADLEKALDDVLHAA